MTEEASLDKNRSVGILLGLGIFFIPIIFSWFTLRNGHSTLSRALSFGWLVLVAIIGFAAPPTENSEIVSKNDTVTTQKTEATAVEKESQQEDVAAVESNWRYSSSEDEMRGTKSKFATISANESIKLGFPYGRSTPELTLRQRPEDGLSIILEAKGQFLCSSFTEKYISAKFDNNSIRKFRCVDPSDSSTGVAFIRNERSFLSSLKKADSLIIEAEFFQEGNRQMKFDVNGLEW